jgi:hypothetical protein
MTFENITGPECPVVVWGSRPSKVHKFVFDGTEFEWVYPINAVLKHYGFLNSIRRNSVLHPVWGEMNKFIKEKVL